MEKNSEIKVLAPADCHSLRGRALFEKRESMYDIIVVGGGPAGLLAAGTAAAEGAKTLLVERMPRVGTKLRITGKGRCNITNARPIEEFRPMLHGNVGLAMGALQRFTNQQVLELLQLEGVQTIQERGDRVYPLSGRASDVAEAFLHYCKRNGVEVWVDSSVEGIEKKGAGWKILLANGDVAEGRVLILACGGQSYPRTGSDGTGYRLAKALGHSITELFPTLVGFFVNTDWGVRERFLVKNVRLTLRCNGENKVELSPVDIELCNDWVGGPGVLRLSRRAMEGLRRGETVELVVDFKSALSTEKLLARFQRDVAERGHEPLLSLARAWVPAELLKAILRRARLSPQLKGSMLKIGDLERLVATLKSFTLQFLTSEDWERAVVTAGGIASQEVDEQTLASRLHKGLFFCGEMLDIDANTGGFNLQLAYSTGVVAGGEAVRYLREVEN